jgi:hypothetical protein
MLAERQRVAIGDSQTKARCVRLVDSDRAEPPQAMICFDDGTVDTAPGKELRGLCTITG